MTPSRFDPTAPAGPRSDLGSAPVWEALRCADCRRVGGVAESERLGRRVCWDCYHESFTDEEVAQAERIGLQRDLARAIRAAVDHRPGKAGDLALLIETARSADEAARWLGELRRLGVEVAI